MTKKVFALASVSALTGLVVAASAAGCSTTIEPPQETPDTGVEPQDGSTPDRKPPTTPETSTDSGNCPTPDAIDQTTFPYKDPIVVAGACTEAELQAFVTFVDNNDDPAKWKASIANQACQDCVFAKETTGWAPVVLNASGDPAAFNVGGCIAVASGVPACGRAYQQWRSCYLEACSECPDGDQAAFSKCTTAANKGACKGAFDDVVPKCGGNEIVGDAEEACKGEKYIFEGPIRAQCIGLAEGGG